MKKITRRSFITVCGAAAAAMALTACGGAASSTVASSAAEPASSSAAAETAAGTLSGNVATGGSTSMKNVIAALTEGKKHKGCKKKTVRKQWLEDLVVNQTMQLVKDDAAMESIIAKVMELQNKENTNIPLYEKQLRDAESGIQNMLNAIQAGILTSSTKERLEQLEETKRELETRIAEEKLAKPKIKEEFIRFWLLRFRKLDMSLKDQRQALVDTFINSIYLYDDKVLITFNYKEGTQTITFEEAAQAASKGNGSDLDCLAAPRKSRTRSCSAFSFRCERGLEQGGGAQHRKQSAQWAVA